MTNSIIIAYPSGSANEVKVNYSIEQLEDVQTINCSVEGVSSPLWLQLRKFSISAIKKSGSFVTLFNEINNSRNMDTSLFIDQAYSAIMKLEHLNSL